jgi:hypothetical protein
MHATSIAQIIVLFAADRRTVKQKDKQSQTPLDLAQDSSNPIKLDIISQLQKRRMSDSFLPKRRSANRNDEEAKNRGPNPNWETPRTTPHTKPPGPQEYGITTPIIPGPVDYQVPDYQIMQATNEHRPPAKASLPNASPYTAGAYQSAGNGLRTSFPDPTRSHHTNQTIYRPPLPQRHMKPTPADMHHRGGVHLRYSAPDPYAAALGSAAASPPKTHVPTAPSNVGRGFPRQCHDK